MYVCVCVCGGGGMCLVGVGGGVYVCWGVRWRVFVGGGVRWSVLGGGASEVEYVPSDLQRSWRAEGPVTRRMKWVHYASRSLS